MYTITAQKPLFKGDKLELTIDNLVSKKTSKCMAEVHCVYGRVIMVRYKDGRGRRTFISLDNLERKGKRATYKAVPISLQEVK